MDNIKNHNIYSLIANASLTLKRNVGKQKKKFPDCIRLAQEKSSGKIYIDETVSFINDIIHNRL
jgi:hypothetical protein